MIPAVETFLSGLRDSPLIGMTEHALPRTFRPVNHASAYWPKSLGSPPVPVSSSIG